ncbi:DUF4817 domain-containing protein [Trichonephila clavipes]|nr:DUF4817 domain-containing protein [Trichonephila clavipes]
MWNILRFLDILSIIGRIHRSEFMGGLLTCPHQQLTYFERGHVMGLRGWMFFPGYCRQTWQDSTHYALLLGWYLLKKTRCQVTTRTTYREYCHTTRFCFGASDVRVLVRRRPGERLQPDCLWPRHIAFRPAVMVWREQFRSVTPKCLGNPPVDCDRRNVHPGYNLVALHFKYDQARRRFVEWAPNEIAIVPDFHKRILFSDEAHFWLNGYVKKQNCRIWSEANPQVYVETPLHPEKLTVWCALWAGGIIGPYFFKNDEGHNVTVNDDRYRAMITNFFIPELNNHDVQEL